MKISAYRRGEIIAHVHSKTYKPEFDLPTRYQISHSVQASVYLDTPKGLYAQKLKAQKCTPEDQEVSPDRNAVTPEYKDAGDDIVLVR